MNKFDKICMVCTIPVGVVFMILGGLGLFVGCNAHFALPPVLGFIPFLLGWVMCVTLIKFWKSSNSQQPFEFTPSAKFLEFLSQYPEFREALPKQQWGAFHQWLDRN